MNTIESNQEVASLPVVNRELPARFGGRCCDWTARLFRPGLIVAAFGVIALASVVTAAYFAGVAREARHSDASNRLAARFMSGLPIANATSAVSSEKFSIATGLVSDQTEGLFVLDHNSGLLQCTVMYPRMGRFLATFSINVAETLGATAKGGGYIMVTGTADFPRSSNNPVGMSVVYVLDTTTGVYGCYGIPFDRQALTTNRPQQGSLVLIAQGAGNPILDRDTLR